MNKVREGASKDKFTGDAIINNNAPIGKPPVAPHTAKMKVAKLIDSYLAEVARDGQLPCAKFQALAEALPEFSRVTDDGLYRAIDTYLKVNSLIHKSTSRQVSFCHLDSYLHTCPASFFWVASIWLREKQTIGFLKILPKVCSSRHLTL